MKHQLAGVDGQAELIKVALEGYRYQITLPGGRQAARWLWSPAPN